MLATQNDAEVLLGNTLEKSKMSKSPEELAQEYVIGEFPDTNSDMFLAAESVHKAFIAGVEAVLKEAKKISKEVWKGGDIVSIVELDELEGLFELGKQEQS